MYKYWAFGLYIESAIEFPELLPSLFEQADITVLTGTVPLQLANPALAVFDQAQVNETEYLLEVTDISKYYAASGKIIIVEPLADVAPRSIRLYLLATVMAAILQQRNRIPLHASGILLNEQLVLFAGHSGAGKSTLLSGLMKKGYQVFSDDVVVLQEQHGSIYALPSYPMIKLWENAMDYLNDDRFSQKDFEVKPGMDKYGVFYHEQFDTRAYPIKHIILLEAATIADYNVQPLQNAAIFYELCKQVYRPHLLQGNNMLVTHFKQLTQLCQQARFTKIIRPANSIDPTILLNMVCNLLV